MPSPKQSISLLALLLQFLDPCLIAFAWPTSSLLDSLGLERSSDLANCIEHVDRSLRKSHGTRKADGLHRARLLRSLWDTAASDRKSRSGVKTHDFSGFARTSACAPHRFSKPTRRRSDCPTPDRWRAEPLDVRGGFGQHKVSRRTRSEPWHETPHHHTF